ncbi:hypothetical protein DYQ86_19340 [Acidobacteria bacterium AB60]|nr:hypothetical protein DYQ86_19340 [Acidobacteria bacterium AB60]
MRRKLTHRLQTLLLMALCVFVGFVLPLLLRSRFDGVWFRVAGDPSAPAEIKLIAHGGKFSETLPVNCFGTWESVTLIADGRPHPWSEPAGNCHLAFDRGITTYTASLTASSFRLTESLGNGTITESWDLLGKGRMVVSQHGRTATYQRASWLRSLFTEEP